MADRTRPREMTVAISVEALLWLEWKANGENTASTAAEKAKGVWSEPEDYAAAIIEGAYSRAMDAGDVPPDMPQRLEDWDNIPF